MVKSYRVAGHSFNIEATCDLSFWNRIEENYGPFETKEGERPLFSLSVCDNFDILDKKIVQIFVTAIKSVKHGFRRKSYKFHLLQTDGNVFLCFLDRLFELS